jgi:hypothetical protein
VWREWRNFAGPVSESRAVVGDPDEKCFTLMRTGIGKTIEAIFGAKKEIPIQIFGPKAGQVLSRSHFSDRDDSRGRGNLCRQEGF